MFLSPALIIRARQGFIEAHGVTENHGFETSRECEGFFDDGVRDGHFSEQFFRDYAKRTELDAAV